MSLRLLGNVDRGLLACLAAIMALGLYNIASAGRPLGANLHVSHFVHLVLGIAIAVAVASVPYRHLEGLAYPIFGLIVTLLLSTALFGKVVNGSRRWLELGPLNLQTSDPTKLAVIVVLAKTLHLELWEGGGLTLRELVRPLNLSRPGGLLALVLALSLFGDALRPPKLERWERTRFRPSIALKADLGSVALGRAPPALDEGKIVKIDHAGVEGHHATLRRDAAAEEWVVVDGPGPGSTFVNGREIEGPTVLAHGDEIRLGGDDDARILYKDSLRRTKPLLPWVALVGLGWLALSIRRLFTRGRWTLKDLIAPVDVVMVPAGLILAQPDLGTSLIVMLIAFSMVLYVGLRPSALLIFIGGGTAFAGIAWRYILQSYQKERIQNLLNPEGDLAGAGYHQNQSLIAVGSGELFGKGHGLGTQTQFSFIPEQQTDFIFSVWAEEQGFVGAAIIVSLFCALVLTGIRVAQRSRDRFGALLAIGVTSMLFWHSIVNMLMVLRLAPVVGVPLPLWSNGGSFVLTTMVGVGLLMNVSGRRSMF